MLPYRRVDRPGWRFEVRISGGDFLDQSTHWNAADFSSQVRDVAKDVGGPRPGGGRDFKIWGNWVRKISLACRRLKLSTYIES